MFYTPLKYLARIALGINFKKIHLANLDKLPMDKPVLLVTNHPTAFIEPCIFGSYLDRPVHFMVRGDLFKKPLYAKLMNDIKMIPIFRRSDGYDNIKNNYGTFEYVYELLKNGALIQILAEASTAQVKRLRPLKKGTARMAFGALEKYGKDQDIMLVPCGLNYTAADEYRSDVMVVFGDPIPIQEFRAEYEMNEAKAIRSLTNRLQDDLKELIIHVIEEEEEIYEFLFEIDRSDNMQPIFPIYDEKGLPRFEREYDIAEQLNQADPKTFESNKSKVLDYNKACKKYKVTDFAVRRKSFGDLSNILILALGFVPFLIGRYGCFIPIFFANRLGNNKVKQKEFVASVKLASGIGFSLLYYLILLILAFFFTSWPVLMIVLLLPFLGYFSIVYQEFFAHFQQARQFLKLPLDAQKELEQLRSKLSHQNEIVLSQD
jgi:1-acyl-sn-glycerol-3-phosphate acyltransferase